MSQTKALNRRRFINPILAVRTVTALISQADANPKPPGGNQIQMIKKHRT